MNYDFILGVSVGGSLAALIFIVASLIDRPETTADDFDDIDM